MATNSAVTKQHHQNWLNGKELVAFMHVMKTGGTSYHSFLARHLETNGHPIPSTWTDIFDITNRATDPEKPLRAISGHFLLGDILTHFPNAQIATVLRSPSNRLLSLYRYLSSMDEKLLLQMDGEGKKIADSARALDPIEWIESNLEKIGPQVSNVYAYSLAGTHGDLLERKNVEDLMEVAQQNLTNIAFIGITEDMHDTILLTALDNALNVPLTAPLLNVTPRPSGQGKKQINADRSLAPFLAHDWILYRIAKRLFQRRLIIRISQALNRIETETKVEFLQDHTDTSDTFNPVKLLPSRFLDRAIAFHEEAFTVPEPTSTGSKAEAEPKNSHEHVIEFWLMLRDMQPKSVTLTFEAVAGLPDMVLSIGNQPLPQLERTGHHGEQMTFTQVAGPTDTRETQLSRKPTRFTMTVPAYGPVPVPTSLIVEYGR